MIGSDIAKRYAKAFFEIADEEKQYEKYFEELKTFSVFLSENPNFQEFLLNPVFNQADKKAVAESLLQKIDLSVITVNFLGLLVDKRRISLLPDIVAHYQKLMDLALTKVRVGVKTAYPLSAELMDKLQKALEQITAKKVEMTVEEDQSLLGGIVVRVGDKLYDGSIRTQLVNIRNLLGEEA